MKNFTITMTNGDIIDVEAHRYWVGLTNGVLTLYGTGGEDAPILAINASEWAVIQIKEADNETD